MKELVPELHDVLKLTVLNHDVSKWSDQDIKIFKTYLPVDSETWKGITQHHIGFGIYPTEPDMFYLAVADSLASSMSRVGEEGRPEYRLNKLWKGPETGKDVRLKDTKDVIDLLTFMQSEPSWQEFLERYENLLKNRPEDFHQGKNIVTLYTHCKLTGQFYRIIRSSFQIHPSEIQAKTQDDVKALYEEKYYKSWQLGIARFKFNFFQQPYRVRDLNIFGILNSLLEEIQALCPDDVLLSTSDELLFVFSDESQLANIAEMAFQKGFWIESVKERRPLNILKSFPKKDYLENLYNVPEKISPPICAICQSAAATKFWPEDYVLNNIELCSDCRQLVSQAPLSSVIDHICEVDRGKLDDIAREPAREELCERCYALRAEGNKLRKLDSWGADSQNKVAWVKLNLDFDQLDKTLESLSGTKISFSVVAEFQEDYQSFLQEFSSQAQKTFDADNVEKIIVDFLCVHIGNFKGAFRLLQIYYELMNQFFPNFLDLQGSPIKIAIFCANVKYPFFEVWKTIKDAEDDILISLQGTRNVRSPAKALQLLIEASGMQLPKGALHRLTRIERTSEKLAELVFQDRRDKDRGAYSKLNRTLRPTLDFRSIFTFARLMED